MTVKDILANKTSSVHTVFSSATLTETSQTLIERNVGALVCTDMSGGIVGMISERDIARALVKYGPALGQVTVSQIMTRDVVACGINDETDYLLTLMTEAHCRHLPVISNGELVGMVSISDVVRALRA